MTGIRKLRKIQLGQETTAGTQVSGSTIWRGTGTMDDDTELIFAEEDVGYLSSVDHTYITKKGAVVNLEAPATFEQVVHILQAGIEAVQASADGSGSDYIYTYPFATTSATASVKTYTVEAGDNQQESESAYCYVTDFNLSGERGDVVMMSATLRGREVSTSTYSSSASLPTIEEILFTKGLMYIDAASGTIGTTAVTNAWIGFDMNVTTGWQAVFSANGNLYFEFIKNVGPEIEVDFTFEHGDTAVAEIAAWRAQTARQIRLKFEGTTFATAGTAFSKKTLQIDLAGKWINFDALDDQDGDDVVTGTFKAAYNATAAKFATIKVANTLSAIP